MTTRVAEIRLSDGSTFLAEVDETSSGALRTDASGRTPVGLASGAAVPSINFDDAMKSVEAAASRFVETLKSVAVPPDSCEIGFGIKVSAEGNAILAKLSGDVNLSVTLKWTRNVARDP
jgi:hypothetical protein